jgi:hypothetical protein
MVQCGCVRWRQRRRPCRRAQTCFCPDQQGAQSFLSLSYSRVADAQPSVGRHPRALAWHCGNPHAFCVCGNAAAGRDWQAVALAGARSSRHLRKAARVAISAAPAPVASLFLKVHGGTPTRGEPQRGHMSAAGAAGRPLPRHGVAPPEGPAYGRVCMVCRADKRTKKWLRGGVCLRCTRARKSSCEPGAPVRACASATRASATRASTAPARASLPRATSRTESACARWAAST